MHLRRFMKGDKMLLMDGEEIVLTIQSVMADNVVNIILSGSMRSETKNDLYDHLKVLITYGLELRLHMEGVSTISSACEAVLLELQQLIDEQKKGDMRLAGVPPEIMERWEQIGFSDLFYIDE